MVLSKCRDPKGTKEFTVSSSSKDASTSVVEIELVRIE